MAAELAVKVAGAGPAVMENVAVADPGEVSAIVVGATVAAAGPVVTVSETAIVSGFAEPVIPTVILEL